MEVPADLAKQYFFAAAGPGPWRALLQGAFGQILGECSWVIVQCIGGHVTVYATKRPKPAIGLPSPRGRGVIVENRDFGAEVFDAIDEAMSARAGAGPAPSKDAPPAARRPPGTSSARSPLQLAGAALSTLFGLGMLGLGGLITLLMVFQLVVASASEGWDVSPGVITAFEMKTKARQSGEVYVPEVSYTYEVDGRTRDGTLLQVGLHEIADPAEARAMAERYAVGNEVPVHHGALGAVLVPGQAADSFVPVSVGCGACTMAVGLTALVPLVLVLLRVGYSADRR